MQFVREASDAINIVRAYGAEGIRIGEQWYRTSLIVTPDEILSEWPARSSATLTAELMATVVALGPAIIVLGSGQRLKFPDPAIGRDLGDRGIGLEVMDTAAACRTYNVLAHEGRSVAAALLV